MQHTTPEPITTDTADDDAPPPWTSDDPTTFAHTVLHDRHPILIEKVRDSHPYEPAHHHALDQLVTESTTGSMTALPSDRHDADAWQHWLAPYLGQSWDRAPFLVAESYFYRRLLDAVDYFRPGPWFWVDPFAGQKAAELADPALPEHLAALDELPALAPDDRLRALLQAAVWGNRADLGFAAHHPGAEEASHGSLLIDDSGPALEILRSRSGDVHLVADNAGRELLADLVLVDDLLHSGWARTVGLHVKPSPYYVSDATTADVVACLTRLAAAGGQSTQVAHRIRDAFASGRARLLTSWFYSAPLEFTHMPPDLTDDFTTSELVVFKGDLNFRRIFRDRHWPHTTSGQVAAAYFPASFLVLRTLKSDVALGLDAATVRSLSTDEPGWRTSGNQAVLQLVDLGVSDGS